MAAKAAPITPNPSAWMVFRPILSIVTAATKYPGAAAITKIVNCTSVLCNRVLCGATAASTMGLLTVLP